MDETDNTQPPQKAPSNISTLSQERRSFITTELQRLAIKCPRPQSMSAHEWAALYLLYGEHLARFSIAQIRTGCKRYAESGERFFPSPGQLIQAVSGPFEEKHKSDSRPTMDGDNQPWGGGCTCPRCMNKTSYQRADAVPDLPPAMSEDVRRKMIEHAEKIGQFMKRATGEKSTVELKAEILARPPLVMTPEMVELEKALYRERMDNLEKRLGTRHG